MKEAKISQDRPVGKKRVRISDKSSSSSKKVDLPDMSHKSTTAKPEVTTESIGNIPQSTTLSEIEVITTFDNLVSTASISSLPEPMSQRESMPSEADGGFTVTTEGPKEPFETTPAFPEEPLEIIRSSVIVSQSRPPATIIYGTAVPSVLENVVDTGSVEVAGLGGDYSTTTPQPQEIFPSTSTDWSRKTSEADEVTLSLVENDIPTFDENDIPDKVLKPVYR